MKGKMMLKLITVGSMALMFFAQVTSASACCILSHQPETPSSLIK